MSALVSLIESISQTHAYALHFRPGRTPRSLVGGAWSDLPQEAMKNSALRSLIFEILDSEQREILLAQQWLSGALQLGKTTVHFEVGLPQGEVEAVFRWTPRALLSFSQWGFPSFFSETLLRPASLHFLMGFDPSIVQGAMVAWVGEALAQKKVRALAFLQSPSEDPEIMKSFAVYPRKMFLDWVSRGSKADLVIADVSTRGEIMAVMDLVQRGTSVLALMNRGELIPSIRQVIAEFSDSEQGRWVFAQHFQTACTVVAAPGLDQQGNVPLFEVLVGTELTKSYIREAKWDQMKDYMQTSGDRTGMRTLNQSILQALTKRKIDVKAGFQASFSPEELDQLLKKIGI